MRILIALAFAAAAAAAAGCGQTGSLYLPDESVETPVEIRGPGEAPAPEDEDADKKPRDRMHMVNWCIWHYRFGQNTSGRFINSKVHALYFVKNPAKRTWNEKPILEPSDRATTYADPRTWNKKEGSAGLRLPMDVWYGKFWGRIQGNNAERRKNHDNQIPEVYLERVIRAGEVRGEPAFVAHRGRESAIFEHAFERLKNLTPRA